MSAPTTQTADPSDPSSTPPVKPDPVQSGAASWFLAGVWLALGLAVRLYVAGEVPLGEWETPALVRAWEQPPFGAENRFFTPGYEQTWVRATAEAAALGSVAAQRRVALVVSLAALAAVLLLATALAFATGAPGRRRIGRSWAWATLIWAIHPTLIEASIRVGPETVAGLGGVLALTGLVLYGQRPGPVTWVVAVAGLTLGLILGGLLLALAFGVGLLIYLLPVPRLSVLAPVLVALVVAGGVAALVQRGPDAERPWRPDTEPLHALSALLEVAPPFPAGISIDPDVRTDQLWADSVDEWKHTSVAVFGSRLLDQLLIGRLGPSRFEDGPWPAWPTTLLDLFLRGGLMFFAVAVLGLLRPSAESAWPRAGVAVAVVAWGLLLVATGLGPHALAAVDLVLLGVAAAGAASSRPGGGRTRRLAFSVGGLMACTLAIAPATSGRPPLPWIAGLDHHGEPGRELVELLTGGGPSTVTEHVDVAQRLMRWDTPSLRQPEAALRHGWQALELAPTDVEAGLVTIRALVENGQLAEAAAFVDQWPTDDALVERRLAGVAKWIADTARKQRLRGDG